MKLAFICGCGHTGTTLLTTMLSTHSEIYTPYLETWSYIYKEYEWILLTLIKEAKTRKENMFLEKTPKHIYHVNQIEKDYDNCKFIFCVRNGYDVIASLEKRYQDFDKAYNRYIEDTQETIKQESKGLVVKYENLIKSPGQTLQNICKHLQLPYEKKMLNYHKMRLPEWSDVVDDANAMMRFQQIKKPIYKPRHKRQKEQCRSPEFDEIMRHFGYRL